MIFNSLPMFMPTGARESGDVRPEQRAAVGGAVGLFARMLAKKKQKPGIGVPTPPVSGATTGADQAAAAAAVAAARLRARTSPMGGGSLAKPTTRPATLIGGGY